jgi:hypothetical protein
MKTRSNSEKWMIQTKDKPPVAFRRGRKSEFVIDSSEIQHFTNFHQ